jgi:exosortase
LILGWPMLRQKCFAIAFLVFAIPLPGAAIESLSIFLQHASADAADVMLRLTGMPVLRTGLGFQFANLSIFVAEECSGVRSTLVLFITSLLAGHLFLRSGWKKALLAFAIFPIGILRNGFRITTIGWLSANVDPGILDSPLHHRGGPIFFVLSLIPLCVLLWILRRSDFRAAHK